MLDAKRLFLIDGMGAVVTATLLLAVLAQFESTFGMPPPAIYFLAAIAIIFAAYSFACYSKLRENWVPFLRAIAIANFTYCILTLAFVFTFRADVTRFGAAYFLAEIILVSSLAAYEFNYARRAADQ